ncbi:hypothetical protein M3202_21590 [Alkalihalobacillus oceani]|uniref:Uncharacterized protein n=1 Tax=Halalkalibacter oceani TaxID=1653776 RepID=A0A9X2DTD7_9BACI|nr:hypothetical protein [Halalkalibacter oceani]MCM3716639.1 hypothetical protein [Halalkalibacter oceani]
MIYAIYCKTGSEMKAKELLEQLIPDRIQEKATIICPSSTTICIKDHRRSKRIRNMAYNYIYIQIKDSDGSSFNEVYEICRGIPYINKIFDRSIPEQEFNRFMKRLGMTINEAEVLIETNYSYDKKTKRYLNQINQALTPEERSQMESNLEEEMERPSCVIEQSERLIKVAKKSDNSKFQRVYVHRSKKKGLVQVPYEILNKALQVAKQENITVSQLEKPKVLLPYINRVLEKELMTQQ